MDGIILGFQVDTPFAQCSVFNRKTIFAEEEWNPKKNRDLLSKVVKTLEKANKNINEISGIFVVNGPGDFTPVRISVLLANNLADNLNIPVYSLCSDKFESRKSLQENFFSKKLRAKKFIEPFFGKEPRIG